ncbi:MAG: branched-chain amino acid ABC transporter substrate-binding protein [Anaerolineales bacterium]
MKRIWLVFFIGLLLGACAPKYTCQDAIGCVSIPPNEPIRIGAALTLSGPDAPYGIDALRGVEIAIADKGKVAGRSIELVKEDDQCDPKAGEEAARRLASDPTIVGVIGETCSGGSIPAARILSEAGMVLISPSSTAPSLTDPATRQPGFFRTIYNDKLQGTIAADFLFNALGMRTLVTVHDGSPYSDQLQEATCEAFEDLGGECLAQIRIQSGSDLTGVIQRIKAMQPDALYYPLYTVDGVAITRGIFEIGLNNLVLISADGLLSTDFVEQTRLASNGMYLSGPALPEYDPAFLQKYVQRYGEQPLASYNAPAYDATMLLLMAIEKVAVQSGGTLYIPRQALREAIAATKDYKGLSGTITCNPNGDCGAPNVKIYQVRGQKFVPIYP